MHAVDQLVALGDECLCRSDLLVDAGQLNRHLVKLLLRLGGGRTAVERRRLLRLRRLDLDLRTFAVWRVDRSVAAACYAECASPSIRKDRCERAYPEQRR